VGAIDLHMRARIPEKSMQTRPQPVYRAPVVVLPVRGCQYHGGSQGEDGFLTFCGKPVKEGYSYCPEHHKRIYQRTPPSLREMRAMAAAEAAPEPVEAVPLAEIEREAA
jgi:hypothetical protein